jgi:hypothetical protein
MMSEQSDPYVLGGARTEQERLVAQAAEFEVQSRWLLDQITSGREGLLACLCLGDEYQIEVTPLL